MAKEFTVAAVTVFSFFLIGGGGGGGAMFRAAVLVRTLLFVRLVAPASLAAMPLAVRIAATQTPPRHQS